MGLDTTHHLVPPNFSKGSRLRRRLRLDVLGFPKYKKVTTKIEPTNGGGGYRLMLQHSRILAFLKYLTGAM